MANKLKKLRRQAFRDQQGRCFYCSQPVWEEDVGAYIKAHGIRKNLTRHVRCTAEHLCARQDKGLDVRGNIVAACLWCNAQRHHGRPGLAPTPEKHQTRVRALVAQGKWHPVAASLAAMQVRRP